MSAFDDRLQAGLSADDEAFLKSLDDEPGMFAQMGATFSGAMKYWTLLAFIFTFLLAAAAFWCGWNAFAAGTMKETILWTGFAVVAFIGVGMLKMWLFMRMNHLVTLREIKRLELQLARLKEN